MTTVYKPDGTVVAVMASDPAAGTDIPAWCRTTGHKLLSMGRQEKVINFVVQRVK